MGLRWDSPIVLSIAGTVALHLLLFVTADAMTENAPPKRKPAPVIEIVDIEVPPLVEPPPPPKPDPEPEIKPVEPPPQISEPEVVRDVVREPRTVEQPPPTDSPPPVPADTPLDPGGGGPVVALGGANGNGPPAAIGKPGIGRPGRGGTGGGTGTGDGAGDGSGRAPPPPPPMSVAMIKKRAKPKGDQSFLSVGKDYPPEARQQGIEGEIRVRLVVSAEGRVTTATLINKLGYGLDELALERAGQIEFEPAIDTDDKPVSSVVVWTFSMTLPK